MFELHVNGKNRFFHFFLRSPKRPLKPRPRTPHAFATIVASTSYEWTLAQSICRANDRRTAPH